MMEQWFTLENSEHNVHAGIRNALRIILLFWVVLAFLVAVAWVVFA